MCDACTVNVNEVTVMFLLMLVLKDQNGHEELLKFVLNFSLKQVFYF